MEFEKPISSSLLYEARQRRIENNMRLSSEEQAKKAIPGMVEKINNLLSPKVQEEVVEEKKETGNFDLNKLTKEDIYQRLEENNRSFRQQFIPTTASFLVPVEEDCEIKVTLSKGGRSSRETGYIDDTLRVYVADLGWHLAINNNGAVINSNARKYKPFDMHTPIGPAPDLGPVESRPMSMDDVSHYNTLLDRLSQSDVKRLQ